MPLADLLTPSRIVVAPPWTTFDETIAGMVDVLRTTGALDAATAESARAALIAREAESSTAVPEIGVGVPHARLASLEAPIAALAIAPGGCYEPAPALAVRIVALVLSPEAATGTHLQLLAGVATTLRSEALRRRLLASETSPAALTALTSPL